MIFHNLPLIFRSKPLNNQFAVGFLHGSLPVGRVTPGARTRAQTTHGWRPAGEESSFFSGHGNSYYEK